MTAVATRRYVVVRRQDGERQYWTGEPCWTTDEQRAASFATPREAARHLSAIDSPVFLGGDYLIIPAPA